MYILLACFISCHIYLFQYMGRLAEPVEVAKACLYLATDATYSTGQIIFVSGGTELDYMASSHKWNFSFNLFFLSINIAGKFPYQISSPKKPRTK